MPNQRVQVAPLAAPDRLRPVANPTNTYVAPVQQTSATEIMRALGTLNPALDRLADKMAKDERERQEAAVDGKLGGMTFEEFKEARKKDPTLGFTGKWARAALDKQYGVRMGHDVRRRVEEELATADLTQVNPEEFLAERVREAQAELGDSKFAQAGFSGITAGLLDKVRDKVNEDRITRTVENRNDNATENFLGTVEWAAGELADPEAMLHVVREQYKQNRDLLGISYGDQDKIMGEVLATLSQRPGMKGYIEKLGELDRDGVRLSTKLGPKFAALTAHAEAKTLEVRKDEMQPLISDYTLAADAGSLDEKEFSDWADRNMDVLGGSFKAAMLIRNKNAQEQLQARALAEVHAQAKELTLTGLTPGLVDMARTGRVADITDFETNVAGKDVSFTRKELQEFAQKKAAEQIIAEGQAQKLDPATIRRNVVLMYAEGGQVDPDAEARIQAFLHGSSQPGDIPASVLNYVDELAVVQGAAPHMVSQIAQNEGDRLFLEAVTTGVELGYSPAEALRQAVWRRDNRQLLTFPVGKDRAKLADTIKKELGYDGKANSALLDDYVSDRLDYFYAAGMTGDRLKKSVVVSFQRTHVELEGRLIDVSGTGMPGSKALPILTDAADAIKEAKPGYAKEKIIFQPLYRGSDRFQAVTATGLPIPGTARTWDELNRLHQERRTARVKKHGEDFARIRELRTDYWASDQAGAGAPGSMIEPIR